MPGIAIIGENSAGALNAPSPAELGVIYNALGGDSTGNSGQIPHRLWLNGAGEALVPDFQLWTPQTVAGAVQAGQIWVDYCGWPMYRVVGVNGMVDTSAGGPAGFQAFAQAVGYTWLNSEQFDVPNIIQNTGSIGSGEPPYEWGRGFQVLGSMNGVFLPSGQAVAHGGVLGIGGGQAALQARGVAAMMALHPPGLGYYFYGVYTTFTDQLQYGANWQSVPPDLYAAFILAVLNGQSSFASGSGSGTISHLAYQIPTTTPPGSSPPINPYSGGGGSSSGGGSGSGSGNGGTPTTIPTTTPAPLPAWKTAAAIAALATGVGVGGYVLFRPRG